jgi:hypothetical protein
MTLGAVMAGGWTSLWFWVFVFFDEPSRTEFLWSLVILSVGLLVVMGVTHRLWMRESRRV